MNNKYNINWKLRIGIHSGPIIAGVVGSKKLTYDIWGDTVNTASRMESHGVSEKVNISGITYELTKEYFECEYREKVPVKNMGAVEMYFVTSIKPEFLESSLMEPNKDFKLLIQQLRMKDLEEEIINKLIVDIPPSMTFNNLQHTLDVQRYAEAIAKYDNLTGEEMLLLKTAAILHDIGYIWNYDSHTKMSVEYAIQTMKKYFYTESQIKQVCDLINATSKPYRPSTRLEKILCDADQSYLLKKNVEEYISNKYRQFKEHSKIRSEKNWYKEETENVIHPKFYTTHINNFNELSQEERQLIYNKMTASVRK